MLHLLDMRKALVAISPKIEWPMDLVTANPFRYQQELMELVAARTCHPFLRTRKNNATNQAKIRILDNNLFLLNNNTLKKKTFQKINVLQTSSTPAS